MAFPEDTDYPPPGPKAVRKRIITEYESSALLALMLQIGLGALALLYALPSVISALMLFPILSEFITVSSFYVYVVVWALLSIMGVLQLQAGYKLYKMIPDTVSRVIWIDVIVALLFGVDAFISAYENVLIGAPAVLVYLAANVVLVLLLNLQSVRNELGGSEQPQSEYQSYSG